MKILKIILVVLLLAVPIATYNIGISEGREWQRQLDENNHKADLAFYTWKTLEDNPPPECSMNDCPVYESADVDGDGKLESVVTERTAMTQQAGRIWIIKRGRVLFKSESLAQIGFSPIDQTGTNTNGFIVHHNSTYQLSPDFLSSFKSDYYEFKDGKFILTKTEDHKK